MIAADEIVFPNNAVVLMTARLDTLDADLQVFKRPLRNTDPVQCIGVYAATWNPDPDSLEMKGVQTGSEPTLSQYTIMVQSFVRDMDQVRGLAAHTTLSKMVRTMLYRDTSLAVSLRELSEAAGPYQERTMRWGIRNQQYFSNELRSEWLYLSTLEFWLETETV